MIILFEKHLMRNNRFLIVQKLTSDVSKLDLYAYVALPSRRNTHDKVHSSVALTIFLEVGFKSNLSCCWLDSRVAYFFIFILVAATWRLFPVDDTCSRTGQYTYTTVLHSFADVSVYCTAYIFDDKCPIFIF